MLRNTLAMKLMHRLDPEVAHGLALAALRGGHVRTDTVADDPRLAVTAFGRRLAHPLGLAAGFDKNAAAIGGYAALGAALAEIGGVTPLPQPGNPRPRLFRLDADRAAINRMGFNNEGMVAVGERLAAARADHATLPMLGVNLASNTASDDPAGDFLKLVRHFAPLADYLTVDVSCPNTRNGRMFQAPGPLADLLARLVPERGRTPMLAKIASDLTVDEALAITDVVLASGIEGMVVANTSALRPTDLADPRRDERGGLSGRPVFEPSTHLLRAVARHAGGRLVLVGVGGVFSAADALTKIRAGATLVQLYTALTFDGPDTLARIRRDLPALLTRDGFADLNAAIGADLR